MQCLRSELESTKFSESQMLEKYLVDQKINVMSPG